MAIIDYLIEYRTTAGPGPWVQFSDGVVSTTGATVTGLSPETSYDFRITAINESGSGAWSNLTTVVTGISGTVIVNLRIGDVTPASLALGDASITKAYMGDVLVYGIGSPALTPVEIVDGPYGFGAGNGADSTSPAFTALEGDLVVVIGGAKTATPNTSTNGYNRIIDYTSGDNGGYRMGVWVKKMGAIPDTTVTMLGNYNALTAYAFNVFVVRGAKSITQIIATNDINGQSPSMTVGSASSLAVVAMGVSGTDFEYNYPNGWGFTGSFYQTDTDRSGTWMAALENPSTGTASPPPFTGGTTAATLTMVIEPTTTSGILIDSILASGGRLLTAPGDGYIYHRFTTGGTLTPILDPIEVEYLVVAGGGGGSAFSGSGAGGMKTGTDRLIPSANTVVIGGGGAGSIYAASGQGTTSGGDGSASSLGSITTTGGGAGPARNSNDDVGGRGGSGAGARKSGGNNANYTGSSGVVGEGNSGGNTSTTSAVPAGGGGGGGKGGAGGSTSTALAKYGGDGGLGAQWPAGSGNWYASGGAGSGASATTVQTGYASAGGGGDGGAIDATIPNIGETATPNTGGGGGAGVTIGNADYEGGTGGSGIVIVRYPIDYSWPRPSVYDNFDRADSAVSLGTATTGQTWSTLAGAFGISSNRAYCVAASGGMDAAVINAGVANCLVAGSFGVSVTANIGLTWRVSDGLWADATEYFNNGSVVYRRDGPSYTNLGNIGALSPGDVLSVALSGNIHDVRVNGVSKLLLNLAVNNAATRHGLSAEGVSTSMFETFWVDDTWSAALFGDDFNRADGALGANWDTGGQSQFSIISNQLVQNGTASAGMRWVTNCSSDSMFSQITYSTTSAGAFVGPAVMMPTFVTGSLSAQTDFYMLTVSGAGVDNLTIRRKDTLATTTTTLGSAVTFAVVAGDILRLETQGTELVGFVNGVERIRRSMSLAPLAVPGGRGVGVRSTVDATQRLDNWFGGDL
jgi:Fibronectin type III domain